MPKISNGQIAKSVLLTALGAAPGLVWYFNARTGQSLFITALGTFIGFALSLPGVSARNVLAGTAAAIIANNAPRSMHGKVYETFLGDDKSGESNGSEGEEKLKK